MSANSEKKQESLVLEFVKAFQDNDVEKMYSMFDAGIVMFVSNAQAEADKVEGRDKLIKRFQEVDYSQSNLKLTVPQILSVEEGKVMVMVHVLAQKKGVNLENFSAFLCYIKGDKITHIWQLDASPAHSDEFWRS